VVRPVESRILDKDVKTVEESSRGRAAACVDLSGVGDRSLLKKLKLRNQRKPESDLAHDYGGNCRQRLSFRLRSPGGHDL
jgi:hypothetical protein